MGFFDAFFGKKASSASVAKDRLQLIIAHERTGNQPEFLPQLKAEIMDLLLKYMGDTAPTVSFQHDNNTDLLTIDIELNQNHH